MASPTHRYQTSASLYVILILAIVSTLPGLLLGITHIHVSPIAGALAFGIAVFGAAFILSWAAEAAQMDISESLALAILALIAVLPEYAVDFVFTWRAGKEMALHPEQLVTASQHFAIANMTGANRLLVGLGWPVVLFLYVFFKKKKELILQESQRVEIFYLAIASLYSLTIPLKGSMNLFDTAILVTLFLLYTRRAAQLESPEPEMVGPVKIIANLGTAGRRTATIAFFLYAGAVIFVVADQFADSLVGLGKALGIKEFLLIQWLAPIASEAPEFIIAATWTLRGHASSAMRALISSKVNQWTLLIGTIPLVFAISAGQLRPFVLDTFQDHELFLTAAQSIFAVAVLVNLRLSRLEGVLLFVLFALQLCVQQIRIEVAITYGVLAIVFHIIQRKHLIPAARMGLGFWEKRK
jgi:cation:H+ antiporter